MLRNRFSYILLLLCFGFSVLFYTQAQEASKPKPVTVATPHRGKIEQKTTYTGTLEADAMVEIYANTSGKLVAFKVNEGQPVRKGDVLARTESHELQLALKQAQASQKAAESNLLKVKATAQIKVETQSINAEASLDAANAKLNQAEALAQAQVYAQFEQAKAGVAAAEASLKKAKSGARSQEVEQAKAAVSGAKASLDNAEVNVKRLQKLYEIEAVTDQDLDNAKTQRDGAKAQHESAVEKLSLVEEGTREEDINAAEAQLQQAQAAQRLATRTVDTKDWEKQIALAQSQVKQARANLRSADILVEIQVWEYDIAAAQSQYDQATEQVDLAKKRLSDATITAPVAGIVVNKNADTGDYAAAAGKPILTIVNMDIVHAVFTVSETEIMNISIGAPVNITAGKENIQGQINYISPIVNPADRTVTVKGKIPNPKYQLKPGMFVEVNIDYSALEESLLLPREAVLDIQDDAGHVFVVADGNQAQKQNVKVGLVWGDSISILEGVTESSRVVVNGHRQLEDGMDVLVVK